MATRQTDFDVRDVIETARLRLEPWDDSHFERFAHFMRDPAVIRYIRPEPLDRDRALEQHEHSLVEWDALRLRQARHHRGRHGSLARLRRALAASARGKGSRDDDVEIGYFVEPARWGEGIATEAAFATRDEAFDRCGIDELIGRCRVENLASARVLAKVGFRRLRLFELDDGIVVEIHRLQRAHWTGPLRRADAGTARDAAPGRGAEYRETG